MVYILKRFVDGGSSTTTMAMQSFGWGSERKQIKDIGKPGKIAAKAVEGIRKESSQTPPPKPLSEAEEQELVQQIASSSAEIIIKLLSNQTPDKSLDLIARALKLNPDNKSVWSARSYLVGKDDAALREELRNIMSLGIDTKSVLLWEHRSWVASKQGVDAMKQEFEFTEKFLLEEDPYSAGAWSVRREYVFEHGQLLGGELSLVKRILSWDLDNHHAWIHLIKLASNFENDTVLLEIQFAIDTLSDNKDLKYPWRYLSMLASRLTDFRSNAIEFMNRFLFDNGDNYFAWGCRCDIASMGLVHLCTELKFTYDILIEQPKNYYAWHYRQWFITTVKEVHLEQEWRFTETILSKDAKNVYAWYHRQWLLDTFGGWESELGYCAKFLEQDIDNEYAWKQRSLVVMRLRLALDVSNPLRKCEINYASTAILKNPESQWAWLHLQSLCSSNFDDINVETILGNVLLHITSGDLWKDIATNRRTYINVVETLHFFVSNGYKPSHNTDAVITDLCSKYKLGFGTTSSSVLPLSYPDSVLHWGWNMGSFRDLVSNHCSGGYRQDSDEVGLSIKKEPHNFDYWCRRQEIAKEIGIDAKSELKFTEKFLFMNESKEYAWSYRKWVLEALGEWENELEFCDVCLQRDIFDGYAWDQRLFVVTKFKREAMKDEVDYAKKCICAKPENEHCWMYLKSLCSEHGASVYEGQLNRTLDDLFRALIDAESCFLEPTHGRVGLRLEVDFEINILKGERRLMLAMDGLLHLLNLGYLPNSYLHDVLAGMSPALRETSSFASVYQILTFLHPQREPYWRTRKEEAYLRFEEHVLKLC